MKRPICLTIAGSDSGGEAGIQADLQCFSDFSCHGLSVISAVTAQNPKEIISLNPVDIEVFKDQLSALKKFFDIKFIKTGILPSKAIMNILLKELPSDATLVSDPLIRSTSGKTLMNDEALEFFQNHFSKRIDFLTPNIPELELLSGSKVSKSVNLKAILSTFANKGIFLKGGHSDEPGVDYFYNGKLWKLEAPELVIKSSHGTGCRISSSFCAALALGKSSIEAATLAKNYVFHALLNCKETEQGQWLMVSPGNYKQLENRISVSEIK